MLASSREDEDPFVLAHPDVSQLDDVHLYRLWGEFQSDMVQKTDEPATAWLTLQNFVEWLVEKYNYIYLSVQDSEWVPRYPTDWR